MIPWFMFYNQNKALIKLVDGNILKSALLKVIEYAETSITPELTEDEKVIFDTLKVGVDRRNEISEIRRKAGKKGLENRWCKDTPKTPQKAKEEPKPIEPIESTTKTEKPKKTAFKPPTVEEVKAYCDSRNNGIDAESFVAFYTSKNWFIGKNKMTNWKMAVITWEKNRRPNERRKEDVTNDRSGYSTDDAADFINYQRELAHSRKT